MIRPLTEACDSKAARRLKCHWRPCGVVGLSPLPPHGSDRLSSLVVGQFTPFWLRHAPCRINLGSGLSTMEGGRAERDSEVA